MLKLKLINVLRANRSLLLFVLGLIVFRAMAFDIFLVPSGSMRPSIQEGDHIVLNRLAYDLKFPLTDVILLSWQTPERGDVVVFSSPASGDRLVKRVIGLPGDTVEMKNKRLWVNGQELTYQSVGSVVEPAGSAHQFNERVGRSHVVQWMDEVAVADTFGPVLVPPGNYLTLGDNRDNSADSRYYGFVPRELLSGRAEGSLYSTAHLSRIAVPL